MRRLFWKFFLIIWTTITASILFLFLISDLFDMRPFNNELRLQEERFALDTAARILGTSGPDAVQPFIDAAANHKDKVTITLARRNDLAACTEAAGSMNERVATWQEDCFVLTVPPHVPGLVSERFPKLVPWLSALLAAAGAAYLLALYLVQPVAQLRHGLGALARGDFGVRIGRRPHWARQDEITALGQDFDVSAARLQELQNGQRELFHHVSHELRSPLSRLQAAIGLLKQNPARQDVMLARMEKEAEKLDLLVGEILTLARLSSPDSGDLTVQVIDVLDLVREIADDVAFEGRARNISVNLQGASSFVTAANGELVSRAIENIMRNALVHTPEGTRIFVQADVSEEGLSLTIEDDGEGVSEADLALLFRPFQRGQNAASGQGHGLGLAIAKHAIERHGGRMSAHISTRGGLGLTLHLPLSFNVGQKTR